jgi:hypothetical protein
MPITVGPLNYLTHPVNFPCGRKPEYPEKTHKVPVAFRKFLLRLEPATSEVIGKCANHLATEALKYGIVIGMVY